MGKPDFSAAAAYFADGWRKADPASRVSCTAMVENAMDYAAKITGSTVSEEALKEALWEIEDKRGPNREPAQTYREFLRAYFRALAAQQRREA